jgi:hypothetical protein
LADFFFALVEERRANRGGGPRCYGGQTGVHTSDFPPYDLNRFDNVLTSSPLLLGDWEGPEGLEEVDEGTIETRAEELKSTRTYEPEPKPVQAPPPPESESEENDPSSDEYFGEGKDDAKRAMPKVRPVLG